MFEYWGLQGVWGDRVCLGSGGKNLQRGQKGDMVWKDKYLNEYWGHRGHQGAGSQKRNHEELERRHVEGENFVWVWGDV